jgi:4-amino-4-deoxy-L-arabinose transferase-like glycosyltransferase
MRTSKPPSLGLILAVFVWMMLVLVGYYYVHKPVTPLQVLALGRAVLDLILAIALVGLAGGVGTRFLTASSLTPLERLVLQAALGLGILALIWLAVGLLGGYRRIISWSMLALGLVIFRRQVLDWLAQLAFLKPLWFGSSKFGKTLGIGGGLLVSTQLLYALAPPVKWDALMYHLQLPRLYLAAGRFQFIPSNPYWGQPHLSEMIYSWGMALRGNETATTMSWMLMAVLLLGILGTLAAWTRLTAGWLAMVALLAGYSFRGMMGWAYADGLAALFGFCVLVSLFAWQEQAADRWLLWVGVFAGFALWSKLTAGILLPLVVAAIFLFKRSDLQSKLRSSAKVVLIALLVFSPWLLANALATGNLIYPYVWPTAWTPPQRLAYFTGQGSRFGWQLLWLPIALTWFGVEAGQIEGMFNYFTDFGPLLLLFAVPGILMNWRRSPVRSLAVLLVGGWITMAVGGLYSPLLWQSRVYFVLLPAVALAAGYGWQSLSTLTAAGVRLERVLAVLVLLILSLSLWQDALGLGRQRPAAVILGELDSGEYLENALGWYAPAMRALNSLPGNSRTLFLWEPRGLYGPLNAQPDVWLDRWFLDRTEIGDDHAILRAWREQGFTHLLVYKLGADFERQHRKELSRGDWEALDHLLSQLPPLDDFGGVYQLYTLTP